MFPQLPPGRMTVRPFDVSSRLGTLAGDVQHISDPRRDGFHEHLRPFALEEPEHVEISVALGGLRPEFACDLDHRLDFGAVAADLFDWTAPLFAGARNSLP